jgi:hypothetical protein
MDRLLQHVFAIAPVEQGKQTTEDIFNIIAEKLKPIAPNTTTTTTKTATTTTSTTTSDELSPEQTDLKYDPLNNTEHELYRTGRLGPKIVKPNRKGAMGPLVYRDNGLELEGHCNFGSIRANVCVFRGKWMYEVLLHTAGIQQLGWASLNCPFTQEAGVGDAPDSYAYDGKRVKKWSQKPYAYGQPWVTGDIIGCCIDLERGEISFYRNGKSLGVAFHSVRVGVQGVAYFPALSISYGEKCSLNFGSRPFKFPVEGYLPLQAPPPNHIIEASYYYVDCLRRLVYTLQNTITDDEIIAAGVIFEQLAPLLLNEYHVANVWYPLLAQIAELDSVKLVKIVDLMNLCMEQYEFEESLRSLLSYTAFNSITLEYTSVIQHTTIPPPPENTTTSSNATVTATTSFHFPPLLLGSSLLRIRAIMDLALNLDVFPHFLDSLFVMKQPNAVDLAVLIPHVWWQDNKDGLDENAFNAGKILLRSAVSTHEDHMYELVQTFVSDTNPTSINPYTSPCDQFVMWVKTLLAKNKGFNRNVSPPGLSEPSVLASVYVVLLRMLQPYFQNGDISKFPDRIFYDGSVEHFDFTRLGGTISHLRKHLPIGKEEDTINPANPPMTIQLFNSLILLFHLGIATKFKTAAVENQRQIQSLAQLADTQDRVARAQATGPVPEHVLAAVQLYRDELLDSIRANAWHHCTLTATKKQNVMYNKIRFMTSLLEFLSQKGGDDIFSYVPEYYLETIVDTFHALRRADPPFAFTSSAKADGLSDVISFLVNHFGDKRIINPDIRDLLLQSISVLLQYSDYVKCFEVNETAREKMIGTLLSCFDTKFWVPVCNLLMRFWRHRVFGQGPKQLHTGSSEVFRTAFRTTVEKDPELLNTFLNKVFNNLNWAVSEFGGALIECTSALPQAQRKATIMFDLAVSLLRLIEVITMEAPSTFLQNELNTTRLIELVLIVVSRTTTGSDSSTFDSVLSHDPPVLEKVSRVSIYAPVVGILINLNRPPTSAESSDTSSQQIGSEKVDIVKTIVEAPSFSLAAFEFMVAYDWESALLGDPTFDRFSEFKVFVNAVKKEVETKKEVVRSPSIELCSICYSEPIDTKFEPCGHLSCHKCINRHLLNNTRCFFCNADVKNTVQERPPLLSSSQ